MILLLLSIAGFFISLYGFSIEQKLKTNPNYTPLCDFSDRASCTKPIKSSMGKIFGISNTIVGMLFYTGMTLLVWMGFYWFVFLGALGACLISLYLAYVLYFRIQTFCLICTLTYMINGALLIISGMMVF